MESAELETPKFLESAKEDLMVHLVECSRQVQQDDDRGEGGCFSRVQFLRDSKEGSFCGVTCLETRLVRIKKVVLISDEP